MRGLRTEPEGIPTLKGQSSKRDSEGTKREEKNQEGVVSWKSSDGSISRRVFLNAAARSS